MVIQRSAGDEQATPLPGISGESEESIYNISAGANFILDKDNMLISANAGFFDITGFDYEILEEDFNFLTLVPDEDVLFFVNFIKKRLDDPYNSPKTSEFRILDIDKKEHKIILTAARIPETRRIFISSLELGRNYLTAYGADSIQTDIPTVSNHHVDQYFHFSYLVEYQPEPVFVLIDDIIAYINEAGVRFFGKENRYDIIGKFPLDFVGEESRERIERTLESMKAGKLRHPVEEIFEIPGKEAVDADISAVPVIFEGIAGLQFSIRDVTLRKMAQKEADLRLRQIEIVNEVLRSSSSSFSLDEMLENILEVILENFGFQSGWIYLKNTDSQSARLASSLNVPVWFRERYDNVNIREWPYNIIFYAGQPRYIENLANHPPGITDVKIMEDLEVISYAGIPVFSENAVIGVLYVGKGIESSFAPFEKATLEEIGKATGSVIVKGVVEERFANEYNDIKEFFGIALKENERIWNTIVSRRRPTGERNDKIELIRAISPRMDIINNLRVIYDNLLHGKQVLKPICLDSVIRGAVYHFADSKIEYDRALYFVFADDNLSYVFINILNILDSGPEHAALRITHTRENDEITVAIRDCRNSGTMDEIEEMIEKTGDDQIRPSNIPLYVTKMLLSAYNGSIDLGEFDQEKVLLIRLKRCAAG